MDIPLIEAEKAALYKLVKHIKYLTSNNQRPGSAFDDFDPRLSFLWQVGDYVIRSCKIGGMPETCPKIHSFNQRCPIQSRLKLY